MKIVNCCSLLLLLCMSCSQTTENDGQTTHEFLGNVMTIDYKIIVGKNLNTNEKKAIQTLILETFNEVDNIYNNWNPDSELSKLNRLEKGRVVKISSQLEQLLEETRKMVFLSEGRFDPTINSVQKLWKKHLSAGGEPSQEEIEAEMASVGFDKVHFQDGTFYKDHDKTSIDLGGIAKGLAVDLLVSRLNTYGYPNVFVEWGGEIKASGMHPENRPWRIFISRLGLIDRELAIAHVDLKDNVAIATSGDYFQNWTVNNNTYFHIFDPKAGRPLEITNNSIASTSVLAHSCLIADVVATVLMLFNTEEEALEWTKKVKQIYPEMQFWIVSRGKMS